MNYNIGIKYNTGIRYNSPRPPIEAEGIIVRGANGRIVAILTPKDGLKDAEINNTLNGECTLSLSLPIDQDKRLYLDENCTICAGEKEFVILTPDAKERVREGKSKWERITAHESWVLLGKQYTTISNDPENTDPVPLVVEILSGGVPYPGCTAGSAKSALSYLLMGTGWTAGIVDVEGIHDLETEKESVLANINKIQQTWGGYLIWDSKNRKVNLRDEEKWQVYTGYQIRYAKNLKGITRTDDCNIVTRLYPFGEDDLDIRTVNNDILYLENFSYTNRVLEDTWTNQEIDNPQELKDAATRELARLCKPRHNYQVEHIDLRNVDKYEYISLTMPGLFPKIETGPHRHETFTIGNMVDIIDEELGINTRARIIHHRYDLIHDWICDVEIGDPLEDLKATIANTVESSEFVNKALRPNTSIGNLLKGFVNTFSTKINSANGRLLWDDGVFEAVEVDENGDLTGRRVRLTAGGIGISNDYGKTYVTAMTGDGVLANTIICSALYALSSGDGYTQMVGDGLRVYDAQGNLRAHIGTYGDGKYGVKIIGGEVSADTLIAGYSAADLETKNGAQDKVDAVDQALADHDANSSPHNLPSYVKMQGDGFKVFDGSSRLRAHLGQYLTGLFGLALYNIYGNDVFKADSKGDLQITGDFTTYAGGQKALEMVGRALNLYDWEGSTRVDPVGVIYSARGGGSAAMPCVAIANGANAYLALAYKSGSTYKSYIDFDKDGVLGKSAAIFVNESCAIEDGARVCIGSPDTGDTAHRPQIYPTVRSGMGIRFADGTLIVHFAYGGEPYNYYDVIFSRRVRFSTDVLVTGSFNATGAKNALVQTEHYGERRISAYETAEYYFGDIGSGTINQDGECIVSICDIFSECVNTDIEYHVFTQIYNGVITSIDRQKTYFTVYGTPGTEFSWELKAKRRGYEYYRLEQTGIDPVVDTANFDDDVCDNKVVTDLLEGELTYNLDDYLLS